MPIHVAEYVFTVVPPQFTDGTTQLPLTSLTALLCGVVRFVNTAYPAQFEDVPSLSRMRGAKVWAVCGWLMAKTEVGRSAEKTTARLKSKIFLTRFFIFIISFNDNKLPNRCQTSAS